MTTTAMITNEIFELQVMLDWALQEVNVFELNSYRESGKPGIIVKQNNTYYYAPAPKTPSKAWVDQLGEHLCVSRKFCKRFIPKPHSSGGCEKVFRTPDRIERYPFISFGIEVFNTALNCLIVRQCEDYEAKPEAPQLSTAEKNKILLNWGNLVTGGNFATLAEYHKHKNLLIDQNIHNTQSQKINPVSW